MQNSVTAHVHSAPITRGCPRSHSVDDPQEYCCKAQLVSQWLRPPKHAHWGNTPAMISVQTASGPSRRIFALVLLIITLVVIAIFGAITIGPLKNGGGGGGNQYGFGTDSTTEMANVYLETASLRQASPAVYASSGSPPAKVEVTIDGEKVGTIYTYREPRELSLGAFAMGDHTYDLKLTSTTSTEAIGKVLGASGDVHIENGVRFEVVNVDSNTVYLWPVH